MEREITAAELVKRAAAGEADAAAKLLVKISSVRPEEQLEALRAAGHAVEPAFWQHLIEYLATGRWSGQAVGKNHHGELRQSLEPKITALFLAPTANDDAAHAREQALFKAIGSSEGAVARVGIDLAGARHDRRAVDHLIAVLRAGHGVLQLHAARALGCIGDPRAVPALAEIMHGSDELLAALARDALVGIGQPAVDVLVEALQDETNEQRRFTAARGLAAVTNERAIPALVAHLSDESYGVRWLCAEALIPLKVAGLRAVLHALATQPMTPWLADSAAHVLQHTEPRPLKEAIKPVLDAVRRADASWTAPLAAEEALTAIDRS